MINRRSFLDLTDHNANFSNQHHGKQNEENKESGLHRAHIELRDRHRRRKHIPYRPRLTTTFGHHPTGLSGNISQRDGPQSNVLHPSYLRQIFLIGKEKHQDEKQNEISAQDHHHAKSIKVKRNIRYQLIYILI